MIENQLQNFNVFENRISVNDFKEETTNHNRQEMIVNHFEIWKDELVIPLTDGRI
jgi:hypothetical protein